jgi:hypothetical protein|tara:strand:- start:815 stop:3208 length:2394 start_codon:yes stop_codon:yes gene_type:complete
MMAEPNLINPDESPVSGGLFGTTTEEEAVIAPADLTSGIIPKEEEVQNPPGQDGAPEPISPAPVDEDVEPPQEPDETVPPTEEAPGPEPQPDEVEPNTEASLEDAQLNLRLSIARGEDPTAPKKIHVKIGDTEIIINHVGLGPPTSEEIKAAIANYRKTPEFAATIDKETGSSNRIRLAVGSAQTPEDKLATLRRFYPDAVAYDGDNFVYTDPSTGKTILHNPEGLDVGDVAGSAREITQGVFSTGGAVAGGTGGFIVGTPTGPGALLTGTKGAIIGSGVGNALGGATFDFFASAFGLTVDTRGPLEQTLGTVTDYGIGVVGQRGGDIASIGLQKAFGGGKEGAKFLYQQFIKLGVKEPPAGAVTGSRALGSIEKGLGNTPSSAQILQDKAEAVIKQVTETARKTVAKFGEAKSTQGAGQIVKKAAENAAKKFGFKQEKIYTEAFDLVGENAPVALNAVKVLRQELEDQLATAPASLAKSLGPAIKFLKGVEKDAPTFKSFRMIRTTLREDLASPTLTGSSGSGNLNMARAYGALTQDMSATAARAGPKAASKIKQADKLTRIWMEKSAALMNKIDKFDADEKAFKFIQTSAKDGGSALARLRGHFAPEEWDVIAATVLHKMGLATNSAQNAAGDVFSVSTFMTNYAKLAKDAPEALKVLFSGPRYKEANEALNLLVRATSSLKAIEKLTNSSNTANSMIAYSTISTLGAALGAAAGGDLPSAAGGVITVIVAPRVAAKLITNPKFVKWLVTPITDPSKIPAHIGRLVGIGKVAPEIKEEIHAYIKALSGEPEGAAE